MAKEKKADASGGIAVAPATPVAPPTEAELMAELEKALASKDFKAVAAASRKLDTAVKAKEKAELDAKRAILDEMLEEVKEAIQGVVQPIYDAGDLDAADGVWYSWDFGDKAPTVRLLKSQPKAKSGGKGGTGKVFDVSTTDMLFRHGGEQYKDGMTYQEAYESSPEKNWRFGIRRKLLQLEGLL